MKKKTKMLIGLGAVGVGLYWAMRRKDDGAPAGLGRLDRRQETCRALMRILEDVNAEYARAMARAQAAGGCLSIDSVTGSWVSSRSMRCTAVIAPVETALRKMTGIRQKIEASGCVA